MVHINLSDSVSRIFFRKDYSFRETGEPLKIHLCNLVVKLHTNHYVKRTLDVQYTCTVFCFELISFKVFLTRRPSITVKYFF